MQQRRPAGALVQSGYRGPLSSDFYIGWFSHWLGQEQAFDRVHWTGQLLPVGIYKLVVQGTVEERVIKVSYARCILYIRVQIPG